VPKLRSFAYNLPICRRNRINAPTGYRCLRTTSAGASLRDEQETAEKQGGERQREADEAEIKRIEKEIKEKKAK